MNSKEIVERFLQDEELSIEERDAWQQVWEDMTDEESENANS